MTVDHRALDAAVDAVIRDWALFRAPRSGGTELVRSEVHEIIGQAVNVYLSESAGNSEPTTPADDPLGPGDCP